MNIRVYLVIVQHIYNTLLSVLFNVTTLHNGVLLLNKCKTVEHWAQESKRGLANEYM